MFGEEFGRVAVAAAAKTDLYRKNIVGYFISSMLAGAYVGLGILLIFSVGGPLNAAQSPVVKLVMGLSFGVALSLVIMAGSELFTGNVFVFGSGLFQRTVVLKESLGVLAVCWLGNLAGSILTGWLYYMTGLATGPVGQLFAATSQTKMTLSFGALFFRGVLCNILVCLAVWSAYRLKEEIAKLVMIFWCLFAFISSGYEHSIANMTLLTVGLLVPGDAQGNVIGYAYNVLVVTFGNMVGAWLFLVVPYHLISRNLDAKGAGSGTPTAGGK